MRKFVIRAALASVVLVGGCGTGAGMFRERSDLVTEPAACATSRFEVYFNEGESRLTSAARQTIGMTAARLQGCEIRRVQVLGLADASGGAGANLSLSQRRAQAVAEALTGAGWPAPAFDVTAAGDAGATAAPGVAEPLRRRTEVVVDAVPRSAT